MALIVFRPRAREARGTRVALRVPGRVGDGSADADALGCEARAEFDSRGPFLALLEGIELGDCAGGGTFAVETGRCVTPVCPAHLGLDHVGVRLFLLLVSFCKCGVWRWRPDPAFVVIVAVFAAAAYEVADAVVVFVGPLGGLTWIEVSQLMRTKENWGREVWLTGRIVAVIYSFEERHVGYDGGRGGLCEDTGSQEKDWMKVHDAYVRPRMIVMSRAVFYKKIES